MKNYVSAALVCLSTAFAAHADVESSENARAILEAQSDKWVSIRTEGGQDYVSFFPLVGWRCELASVRYGLNGSDPTSNFEMAPCDTSLEESPYAIHIKRSVGTVSRVKVKITYKSGQVSETDLTRAQILVQ